jgi:hypothetical protein
VSPDSAALQQLDHALAHRLGGISATAPKSRKTRVGSSPGRSGSHPHQQVPGVRIGVVDAVGEDLLAVDLDHLPGQGAAVDADAGA